MVILSRLATREAAQHALAVHQPDSLLTAQQRANGEAGLILTIAMTILREDSPELCLGRKGLPSQCGCGRTNAFPIILKVWEASSLPYPFRVPSVWFQFYQIHDAFVATTLVICGGYQVTNAWL